MSVSIYAIKVDNDLIPSGNVSGGSGGTVTSVGLSVPSALGTVSGSPVTGSGTLSFNLSTQAANLVFAGPVSGGSATPTFRSLVAADIPSSLGATTFTGVVTLPSNATSALQAVTLQQLNSAVLGLYSLQGGYDPTATSTYPTASNTTNPVSATIVEGMVWVVTVNGTIEGTSVKVGDEITALVANPGTTPSNWNIVNHVIGYVPLSNVLANTNIFIGNSSNVATGVALSGDGSLANTGALTISSIGGKTVSLSGSLTTTGNFTLGITLTGNTSITLPTSGTLMINPMLSLGDSLYAAASGVPTRLAGNTTTSLQFLTSTGIGGNATAPVWTNFTPTVLASGLSEYGYMYQNSLATSTGYSSHGSGTFTFGVGGVQISGGTNAVLTNYQQYDTWGNSNVENSTRTFTITVGSSLSSTSYGPGFGYVSQGIYGKQTIVVQINLDTTNLGKITVYTTTNGSGQVAYISTSSLSISAGHILNCTIRFIGNKLAVSVYNTNTGHTNTFEVYLTTGQGATLPSTTTVSSLNAPNSWRSTLHAMGNSTYHTVSNDYLWINDVVGNTANHYTYSGDSITKYLKTSNIANRRANKIMNVGNCISIVNAGSGNCISDLNTTEQLALSGSGIIIVLIGINDIQNGSSAATILTNSSTGLLATYINALITGGKVLGSTLFIGLIPPCSGAVNASVIPTLNANIISVYGSSGAVIDYNTPLNNGSNAFLTGYTFDNIHPNDLGNSVMHDTEVLKLNINGKATKTGNYYPLLYSNLYGVMLSDITHRGSTPNYTINMVQVNSATAFLRMGNDLTDTGTYFQNLVSGSTIDGFFFGQNCTFDPGSNQMLLKATNASSYYQANGGHFFASYTGTAGSDSAFNNCFEILSGANIKIGTAVTHLVGFYGATPVVQPSGANQASVAGQTQSSLTDSTGGTAGTTLASVGGTVYATDYPTIINWISSLAAELAKIKVDVSNIKTFQDFNRTNQISLGLIKGSA